MTSDLSKFRDQYHQSVAAFIRGDPDVQVCGVLDRAAQQISDGEGYSFDTIAWVETADLAYEVGMERNRAKLAGAAEKVPVSLRVTTVFRREDDGWKIVHRHADPITDARPIQSVMQPSGDGS